MYGGDTEPGRGSRERDVRTRAEHRVRHGRDAVGDQHFLREAHERERKADDEVAQLRTIDFRAAELRHHFRVMQHGTGDQVRKYVTNSA